MKASHTATWNILFCFNSEASVRRQRPGRTALKTLSLVNGGLHKRFIEESGEAPTGSSHCPSPVGLAACRTHRGIVSTLFFDDTEVDAKTIKVHTERSERL